MKIKIAKVKTVNPSTSVMGCSARVVSNGTAEFDMLCEEASKNTMAHRAEVRLCFELGLEEAARQLKQGKIVDLGPLGKLYPSATSGWFASADKMTLDDVHLGVNFRPSDDIRSAIAGAAISFVRPGEDAEDEEEDLGSGNGGGSGSGSGTGGGGNDDLPMGS